MRIHLLRLLISVTAFMIWSSGRLWWKEAQTQASMIEALLPYLTEEEEAVYKRGRNAKSYTSAKNASIGDYRKATGMEALVGYLYLTGQEARIMELIKTGLKELSMTL